MNADYRQHLSLLCSMNELVEVIRSGEVLEEQNYDDLKKAFSALGVPDENRMVKLINTMPKKQEPCRGILQTV